MDKNTPWLLLAILLLGAVAWFLLNRPTGPEPVPVVENADNVSKLNLSRIPKEPTATLRPLIEYLNAASTRSLIKAPAELEAEASKALPRPLIEYSNSALSIGLEEPEVHPVTLPRPLVEYANSGVAFTLEPLTGVDFSHVQPRPLVEFADGGWALNLSVPTELLRKTGEGK